uniref:Peptidase M1 membrane alanine aminopeptidase domain-containing protein n=1 Tax=Candidatus Kentrum sp. FW TaxID=2126338 RepID=A0A450SIZ9_9GAMM|nr:MAG: hypothetical protein BECKFW1821B_GA0114236_101444 [Candidatus Kentron sp. FW]
MKYHPTFTFIRNPTPTPDRPIPSAWQRVLLVTAIILVMLSPAHGMVRHALIVELEPTRHYLEAEDRISLDEFGSGTVPTLSGGLNFTLHAGLDVTSDSQLEELAQTDPSRTGDVPLRHYRVTLHEKERYFTLRYAGTIHHPIAEFGREYARSFGETPGTIGEEGVFLSGASHWYPHFKDQKIAFTLESRLPPGWESISQGERVRHETSATGNIVGWAESAPQEEIYLIAAPFHVYEQSASAVRAYAYLREPDATLAGRYLDATGQYMEMYRQLIGPYPYAKFALVENFWETGYGMPSFTLLGSKVIRLPFILHTSYPHEILHNWWGNGVYVDYDTGNWAEGLTAYLADHLIKEQRGQGHLHRRQILHHYADFVDGNEDFPLTEFRSRHSSVTEAVGYGKTQMLFHMLRRKVGDEVFKKALRRFFRAFRFKSAGYEDLASAFGDAAETDLSAFFAQWVERTGAPQLAIASARAEPHGDGFRLTARIEQRQSAEAYTMEIPMAISLAGEDKAFGIAPTMTGKDLTIRLDLARRPLYLAVDPKFDVFRRLHWEEIPPALSQAFGADRVSMVLPADADSAQLAGYRTLARMWRGAGKDDIRIVADNESDRLPEDRAIWVFGWENRFLPVMAHALERYEATLDTNRATIGGKTFTPRQHSVVIAARNPDNPDRALIWVGADGTGATTALARKLPHYRKYSFLAFTGDETVNLLKEQWQVVRSPMQRAVTQMDNAQVTSKAATTRPAPALIRLPPARR